MLPQLLDRLGLNFEELAQAPQVFLDSPTRTLRLRKRLQQVFLLPSSAQRLVQGAQRLWSLGFCWAFPGLGFYFNFWLFGRRNHWLLLHRGYFRFHCFRCNLCRRFPRVGFLRAVLPRYLAFQSQLIV